VSPERRANSKLLSGIRDMAVGCINELSAAYDIDIGYSVPTSST